MKLNRTTKSLFALCIPVLLLVLAPVSTSTAQTAHDPLFVNEVNSARAFAGLRPLARHAGLESWACTQSQKLASRGTLSHSDMNALLRQTSGATSVGENVAYGSSVSELMGMWLRSTPHARNIHNSSFTHIGSCTVEKGRRIYVTHVFAGIPGGGPQAPPSHSLPTCFGRPATILAAPGVTTYGTSGPDVIIGTPGPDRIEGGGGRDRICAKAGNDTVLGGSAKDKISLGKGNDVGYGGTGSDRIKGNSGIDTISGQNGSNDRCYGGTGSGDRADASCEQTFGIP